MSCFVWLLVAVFVIGLVSPHAAAGVGSASMCTALLIWAVLWLGRQR